MDKEIAQNMFFLAAGFAAAISGFLLFYDAKKKLKQNADGKNIKRRKNLGVAFITAGLWLVAVRLLPMLFGPREVAALHVEIMPERVELFGFSISSSVVVMWWIMAVLTAAAIVIRLFVIPRFKDVPHGLQGVLEVCIGGIRGYTKDKVGDLGHGLSAYLFSATALLIGCSAVELIGLRPPTADITMTFALALITFILINYYGIKCKGFLGRIKSFAHPTPVVAPFRIVSDVAVPVSMACRLFGNMLGGMIVMHLLYSALGDAALGIPSVIGLYFNIFHPLIQAYIFVTLTLTFISEAVETE